MKCALSAWPTRVRLSPNEPSTLAPLAPSCGNVRCQVVYILVAVVVLLLMLLILCPSLFCLLDGQHVLTEHPIRFHAPDPDPPTPNRTCPLACCCRFGLCSCSYRMHISYGHKPKMLLSLLLLLMLPLLLMLLLSQAATNRNCRKGAARAPHYF